jgi:hypothetical protein
MLKDKNKKAFIEWGVAILLLFLAISESPLFNYYHLSPTAAHEQSERTHYYGPSEVVEEIDLGEVRIFLGKYKDWFSANSVLKHAGVFWAPGSHVGGTEIKQDQDITYSWSGSRINDELMLMLYYGIVTNPKIVKVELDVVDNHLKGEATVQTLSYPLEKHRMFLFYWNELEFHYHVESLRGMDENGEVVYEMTLK